MARGAFGGEWFACEHSVAAASLWVGFARFIPRPFPAPAILRRMEAGIVGLPNVGKSTLFNALTQSAAAEAANYPFCTIEPNEGVVPVPDPRLAEIESFIPTQKVIPASLKLVDIAGIVKGASEGAGLGNKFLAHIREVDAILQVVRCFEDDDVVLETGELNPLADIDTIATELMLADLELLENAKSKAERKARSGDKDAKLTVLAAEKAISHLGDGNPIRTLGLPDDESKILSQYGLLSGKPILFVANVDEDKPDGSGPLATAVREYAAANGAGFVPVCAKIEAELAELDEADRAELLADYGLTEPALNVLAREAYRTLGLQSYFTAGPKEIRAWTVPVGATAPQAAGVIHTDFERGFIRANIYAIDDLREHGSEKAIKEAGKLRVEGKDYVMRDGDITHFLFNV